MKLQNAYMRVEIAEDGAELMSIYNLKTQSELLWNGDAAFWKRRSPILFPNVGKTFGNVMRINGASYPTAQHGFARDRLFDLEESSETSACYLLRSDADTLARYPYDFELRVRYTLMDNRLEVCWMVMNPGKEDMVFTIGGHPAFCFADAREPKQNYMLRFPGKNQLEYILLDPASGTALPKKKYTLVLDNHQLPLSDALFANDAMIFDGAQIQEAWLCHRDGTPRIGVISPDFPNYGVWSVAGAPFVCLEPWAGRCDNHGYDGEVADKPNVNRVAPGETFEKSYTILLPEK